jgi:hypothetical protein
LVYRKGRKFRRRKNNKKLSSQSVVTRKMDDDLFNRGGKITTFDGQNPKLSKLIEEILCICHNGAHQEHSERRKGPPLTRKRGE